MHSLVSVEDQLRNVLAIMTRARSLEVLMAIGNLMMGIPLVYAFPMYQELAVGTRHPWDSYGHSRSVRKGDLQDELGQRLKGCRAGR